MAKAVYLYDHTYYSDGVGVYSSGAFTQDSWDRYLANFSKLTVVGNISKQEADYGRLNRVDREGISFEFVDNVRSFYNYFRYNLGGFKKLEEIIQTHDAVIVRVPSEISLIAVNIARKLHKPYAIEVVGCVRRAYWNHGTIKGKLLAWLSFYRTRSAVAQAPYILYVTKLFLQEEYPSSGIQVAASNVEIGHESWPEVLSASENFDRKEPSVPVFGHVGSYDVRFKGQEDLLRALALLRAEGHNAKVKLVGPGNGEWLVALAEKLEVSDSVEVVGKLPKSSMLAFMDSLDVYVHTSYLEGLPRTVIEAMSRGRYVIGTSVGGIPELLPPEYLMEAGDVNRLVGLLKNYTSASVAEKLKTGAANYQRSLAYGKKKLKVVRADFYRQLALECS